MLLAATGCKPTAHKAGVTALSPPVFQMIPFGYDPSISGLAGAVGNIVQNSGALTAWVKTGSDSKAWAAFPSTGGGGTVSSATAPLSIADGGVMKIATASETDAGSMSATDKIKLDNLPNNPWSAAAQAAIQAKVPTATMCDYVPPAVGPWTADSNAVYNVPLVGGAIGANEADGRWITRTQQFLQQASAHPWGVAWRGAFAAPQSGKIAYAGLYNNATGHGVFVGTDFSASTTHLLLSILGGAFSPRVAFTIAADANEHDFLLWFDGTSVSVVQDGVLQATTSTLTNFVNEATGFAQFGSLGMTPSFASAVGTIEYCYVPSKTFTETEQFCTWPDGTSTPGTCMFDDEFSGSVLSAAWVAHDDWEGPLMLNAGTGDTCFRHENVSVSGGLLHLGMTAHTRSSCPQSWTATAFYNANFPGFPSGQPTHFDDAVVDTATFNFTYGHVWYRARFGAVGGAWSDVTLWGVNCQGSRGFIGEFVGAFFAHDGGPCNWPQAGSEEFDIPSYINVNGLIAVTEYTYNHNGAPFFGNFFGTDWYGVQSNQSNFLQHPTISDPTANFHVYEADWFPEVAPVDLSHYMFWIDGVLLADTITSTPSWQVRNPTYPMLWFADYGAIDGGTVGAGKSTDVDYFRVACDPGVPCTWTS
jgi:hypothetical protein